MKNLLVFIALIITACTSSYKIRDNSTKTDNTGKITAKSLVYQSTANGVAEILLTLKPDYTFSLYMRILPQPDTDEKESTVRASGKWSKHGNWNRLVLKGKKVSLVAVFDKNYADKNQFKIIDEKTVDINDILTEIPIWGVPCIKKIL